MENSASAPIYFDATFVSSHLSYARAIDVIRNAMIQHSAGETKFLLRSFIALDQGKTFAQMPAVIAGGKYFGAKLVSVFAAPDNPGRRTHRGIVILFEGKTGSPVAYGDAEAITRIRTAAASAAATDALAQRDAKTLAIFGSGLQAEAHARALSAVRSFERVTIWARDFEKAKALASKLQDLASTVSAQKEALDAAASADVICTVTASREPVLMSDWVNDGAHINLVGSSGPGPYEADLPLVARAKYFGDCREHVLQHGAEFIEARKAGLVDNAHFLAEIGEVFAGKHPGRGGATDVTIYKSLGHAVQDLAALAAIYEDAVCDALPTCST